MEGCDDQQEEPLTPDAENPFQMISGQREWYSLSSRRNRAVYYWLKTMQLIFAAAIPVVAVASKSDWQRWTSAGLGALVGILEGIAQLGQYQQNWMLYRATSEALKREEFLHSAGAGPYAGVADPDKVYVERCDAIMSGENAQWLKNLQSSAANGNTEK